MCGIRHFKDVCLGAVKSSAELLQSMVFRPSFGKERKSSRHYYFLALFLRGSTEATRAVGRGGSPSKAGALALELSLLPITRDGWIMITVIS